MKQIMITIPKGGKPQVRVLTEGLGLGCLDLTKGLEARLGGQVERTMKEGVEYEGTFHTAFNEAVNNALGFCG